MVERGGVFTGKRHTADLKYSGSASYAVFDANNADKLVFDDLYLISTNYRFTLYFDIVKALAIIFDLCQEVFDIADRHQSSSSLPRGDSTGRH